jgi:hypothetical protein
MSVSDATSVASAEDEEMTVTLGEASDVDDDTGDEASNNDMSNDDNKETEEDMFFGAAWEIMNRLTKKLGMPLWRTVDSTASLARRKRSSSRCGACWGKVACAPRIASFGLSIS